MDRGPAAHAVAFRDANPFLRLEVPRDGVEAMALLGRDGAHSNASRPDRILPDLNLPKMKGRQVLALIKKDDDLKSIPTVILTSSELAADVMRSCRIGMAHMEPAHETETKLQGEREP